MKKYLKYIALHAVDHCNLSCVFCSNNSPFFKKKEYKFEDYEKWIDILLEKNFLAFGGLSINGGEPFLHSNLEGFVLKFKNKYKPFIQVTTNGFWLKSIDNVEKYNNLLKNINKINISTYPELQKTYAKGAIEMLQKNFDKKIEIRGVNEWTKIKFSRFKEIPNLKSRPWCAWTQLISDGRLAICPTAGYADSNPNATPEFLENRKDIFFDIVNDKRSIKDWITKWPLDACSFCSMWKNQRTEWKSDVKIRKNHKKIL